MICTSMIAKLAGTNNVFSSKEPMDLISIQPLYFIPTKLATFVGRLLSVWRVACSESKRTDAIAQTIAVVTTAPHRGMTDTFGSICGPALPVQRPLCPSPSECQPNPLKTHFDDV